MEIIKLQYYYSIFSLIFLFEGSPSSFIALFFMCSLFNFFNLAISAVHSSISSFKVWTMVLFNSLLIFRNIVQNLYEKFVQSSNLVILDLGSISAIDKSDLVFLIFSSARKMSSSNKEESMTKYWEWCGILKFERQWKKEYWVLRRCIQYINSVTLQLFNFM